jgi:hypothetical protein
MEGDMLTHVVDSAEKKPGEWDLPVIGACDPAAMGMLRGRSRGCFHRRDEMTRVALAGAKGTVELRDEVAFLRWNPGLTIEEQDAAAAVAAVRKLSGRSRYPLLVDMARTESVTVKARRVFAASDVAPTIALLGESPVDRMIVNFFLRRHRPPCPTRFFTCVEDAMRWLKSPEQAASGAGTKHSGHDGEGGRLPGSCHGR